MKLCFSTLGCHDCHLEEILKLANKYQIQAIEVRGIDSEMSNSKILDFHNDKAIQLFPKYNVIPFILGTSCKFHLDKTRDEMIQKAFDEIDIASKNHFHAIRVFGNLIVGDEDECIQNVSVAINEVCKYALCKGVHVYLEVHGDFNTIERLNKVLKCIEYDNFGLIWDIYHTHSTYKNNWKVFYNELKKYIKHVHIKDAIGNDLVLPGHGEIEIVNIMNYMIEDGYNGYFSLEWERKWNSELEPLEIALIELNKLLSTH